MNQYCFPPRPRSIGTATDHCPFRKHHRIRMPCATSGWALAAALIAPFLWDGWS
jgi:hypothetical protein